LHIKSVSCDADLGWLRHILTLNHTYSLIAHWTHKVKLKIAHDVLKIIAESYCVQTDTSSVPNIPAEEIEVETTPFARGRYGKVYKAKWKKANVAIKVIKARTKEDKKSVLQEASITLCLKNQHVIEQFGITFVKTDQLGIVMEWAKHGSLDMWIGKVDRGKLTNIALGIVSGLKYIHSQNVMHRDIKPQNILMFGPEDDMIPKIDDFGVSRIVEQTMSLTAVGTAIYMAPELKFLRYSFPADIFSLATLLFEVFNERLIKDSSTDVTRCIASGKIPENCKVPTSLRSIIQRGWAQQPQERPPLVVFYSTLQG